MSCSVTHERSVITSRPVYKAQMVLEISYLSSDFIPKGCNSKKRHHSEKEKKSCESNIQFQQVIGMHSSKSY